MNHRGVVSFKNTEKLCSTILNFLNIKSEDIIDYILTFFFLFPLKIQKNHIFQNEKQQFAIFAVNI
jgi:hypothetical protein